MTETDNTRPSLAECARTLAHVNNRGMLSTLDSRDGYPYGSVVEYLPLPDGDVVMLLSRLAEHQINVMADRRASLLIAPALGDGELLSQARLCLLGDVSAENDGKSTYAGKYLALHPAAESYLNFSDFEFYRLQVNKVRYIAGFGRMGWIGGADYQAASIDPLGDAAAAIVKHMSEDHEQNLVDYAHAFAGLRWAESCAMTSIDRFGFDMFCRGQGKAEMTRLVFDAPLTDPQQVRPVLVALAQQARQLLNV